MSVTSVPSVLLIVTCWLGSSASRSRSRRSSCGIVPVHPHPEPDRLLGLARGKGEDALLAQADELGDAVVLDVALAREPEIPLDVDLDPEPLAVEAVLIALIAALHRPEPLEEVLVGAAPGVMDAHRVVGRDRSVQEAPALAARILGSQASEDPAIVPEVQDLVLLGDEIGLGADWSKHRPRCSECWLACGLARRRPRPGRPTGRRGRALPPRVDSVTKQCVRGYPSEPVTTAVRSPSRRSAFSAAFLSFIFPGLGQAYAGAYVRGLVLAAPLLIAVAISLVYVLTSGIIDFGLWISQSSVLGPLAIVNVVLLAYRALACLDAYRLAIEPAAPPAAGIRRIGRKSGQIDPLSIIGLRLDPGRACLGPRHRRLLGSQVLQRSPRRFTRPS